MRSLEEIFAPGGPLDTALSRYAYRPQQVQMAAQVAQAFGDKRIALIEAGTGTGKSMAYLVPALLQKGRTVVSTQTITLQEQLIHKDLPNLIAALGVDSKAVLVKGMNNYLCLRKLEDAQEEKDSLLFDEKKELEKISQWSLTTDEGSRSDLDFVPTYTVWDRVSAEADACTNHRCNQFKECHFFKARKAAENAQILVVNHHLLMADLVARQDDGGILPDYDRLIIDEAHNIEDTATDAFAWRVSRSGFNRLLIKLENRLRKADDLDLLAQRRRLTQELNELSYHLAEFCDGGKVRFQAAQFNSPAWQDEVVPVAQRFINEMKRYLVAVDALSKEFDVRVFCERLNKALSHLATFALEEPLPESVRWVEMRGTTNVQLINAELDISTILKKALFSAFPSTVLTSATLATGGHFKYVRNRLGLNDEDPVEAVYDSPFDYQTQAMLAIPTDIPLPQDPGFTASAAETILQICRVTKGDAFVLFTSYAMLEQCYQKLSGYFPILRQGELDRKTLLERFRNEPGSVLFGTDSFWEGVDVAGDALRCVIITKLPFKVPTEPIVEARLQAIADAKGSPFGEYSLPQAIVKFKQGFGRLIRDADDRGAIVCLDRRLVTKSYGSLFLKSIPNCRKVVDTTSRILSLLPEVVERAAPAA